MPVLRVWKSAQSVVMKRRDKERGGKRRRGINWQTLPLVRLRKEVLRRAVGWTESPLQGRLSCSGDPLFSIFILSSISTMSLWNLQSSTLHEMQLAEPTCHSDEARICSNVASINVPPEDLVHTKYLRAVP